MKKLSQDSNTTVMLIWCLKQVKDFIFRYPINGSFCWGTQKLLNVPNTVLLFSFRWWCWWRFGEIGVNRTNYQGCQFDVHFIQCQTSTDISWIVHSFVQYVQNYFQYVYIPIYPTIGDKNIGRKSWWETKRSKELLYLDR